MSDGDDTAGAREIACAGMTADDGRTSGARAYARTR